MLLLYGSELPNTSVPVPAMCGHSCPSSSPLAGPTPPGITVPGSSEQSSPLSSEHCPRRQHPPAQPAGTPPRT